ncbi:hypothetical protein OSTOST_22145 [Ostertagia ostertagi]
MLAHISVPCAQKLVALVECGKNLTYCLVLKGLFSRTKKMLYILNCGMAFLPGVWIELLVMFRVYMLAAYCALKELLFEAANQGIKKRLENEIRKSRAIRSARNKRVFITGADGTIGREVVKSKIPYCHMRFTCYRIVGNRAKANVLFESLNGSRMPLTLYEVDFADPHEVERRASNSIFIGDVERHMCVNVVSQALLLNLLKPLLARDARILFLSSSTATVSHYTSSMLQGDLLSYYVGPYQAYCLSKLVLSVYIEQLSQHRPQRIATMHPGVVPGTLYRHNNMLVKFVSYFILPFFLR